MDLRQKKLGVLIACPPEQPGFRHGARLAETALAAGVDVYLYCIDEAVRGIETPALQSLRPRGLKLYACAFGAQKNELPLADQAVFAGLTLVSDIIADTNRFVCFT
jgi:hypothetical protein